MRKSANINRRDFIRTGALAAGGLLISFSVPARGLRSLSDTPLAKVALNAFLHISEDNSIHIIISKVEIGQGVWTTLPMLIAEELDFDWSKIKVAHRPGGKGTDFAESVYALSTGGSDSTRSEFDRYRLAGATARTMLVSAAANRWNVAPEACRTENGYVISGDRKLSYGAIASDASKLPVPSVKLREPAQWKYIGKPQKRLDTPDKTSGKTKYGIDIQFPGLLTAVVAYPPVFGGKVKTLDAARAKVVQGVHDVLEIPAGVAVLADHYWAAKLGRDALQIEWDHGAVETVTTTALEGEYKRLSRTAGRITQHRGNVERALSQAVEVVEAEFTFPFLAHSPMEPLNCTVRITQDKCEVWAGTQSPLIHQAEVAVFLGLKPEQVEFNTPAIGGSFGRRGTFKDDWMMDAVHIAKASGRAVKLVWSREDDIRGGYYRPFYVHRAIIGIGSDGYPQSWRHHVVGQSLFGGTILENDIAPNGIDYSSVGGVHGSPYLTTIPDHSVELHTTKINVPVSAWRSVGHTHTCFVMESLIDELATLARKDPVDYRRTLLKDHPRHLAALNLAAEKAGWSNPMAAGRFRGVAVHEAMNSYVAQIVELSVVNKKIRLHRVVCAIDCGLAVNPDGVRAQMEGGIVYGLTAALYGEITLEQGKVTQSNFHNYRMLRINEMPQVEVHIVPSEGPMGGAGEPGVPPIAPALANALFAATGKRVRRLPVNLEKERE
ncbi:xanthine dehydrogenase family protein molybdopterin-binding subunit [Fulvivirgaceae bacterium PWU4]|uniref:Xanthine dehydrogenase family protein molybdopterin-binding subunit n=1 Tax=Chryseosolibacter histidini TaxID=2782349 RepID=A0AAP2DP15_9BACT|nr:xanthine dehydrogenase family protein molybdopterin-binding subunit [Chryseosolibacter histidini]MBT1697634.1 xanthine dehydrogenase family protein molybdopterin-binding subunit [Chryseosolibacter histidini]